MKKILLFLFCALFIGNVAAQEVAGVTPPETAQVGGKNLLLNGAGLRTKFFIKIYVGALYLPQKQTNAAAVLADEHEQRMALHVLRNLTGEQLFDAVREAIADNQTPAGIVALNASIVQLKKIFDEVKNVKSGDVITLDYAPTSGLQIGVNGVARGTIAGAEFHRALMQIWLGDKPIQADLKRGLLGG